MARRGDPAGVGPELGAFLLGVVKTALVDLSSRHQFASVVSIPSRTWTKRVATSHGAVSTSFRKKVGWIDSPPVKDSPPEWIPHAEWTITSRMPIPDD